MGQGKVHRPSTLYILSILPVYLRWVRRNFQGSRGAA